MSLIPLVGLNACTGGHASSIIPSTTAAAAADNAASTVQTASAPAQCASLVTSLPISVTLGTPQHVGGSITVTPQAPALDNGDQSTLTSSSSIGCKQFRLLPAGAKRMNGYFADKFGRTLIWLSKYDAWKSLDEGVLIDPSSTSVPADVESRFKSELAKLHANAKSRSIRPQACNGTPDSVAIRTESCTGVIYGTSGEDISYADQYGDWGTYSGTTGTAGGTGESNPPQSCNGDPCGAVSYDPVTKLYTDQNGAQYAWDPNGNNGAGQWLLVVSDVTSTPSDLSAYVDAYNGINTENTVMDWFLLLWMGLPDGEISGGVSMEEIEARFGAEGVLALEGRILQIAEERIIAELGTDSMTNMADWEANQMAAEAGYTSAPFASGVDAFSFETGAADSSGSLAGEQLVKVTPDSNMPGGSGFLTTIDQISNADGSLMSPAEIADKLALPYTPTTVWYVNDVPVGTEMLGGIVGSQGAGMSGGAMQYLPINNSVGFGGSAGLGP